MSLFDLYVPRPVLICPVSKLPVARWEACTDWATYVEWTQGIVAPKRQGAKSSRQLDDHPNGTFSIEGSDANGTTCVAQITVEEHVWVRTQLTLVEGKELQSVTGTSLFWLRSNDGLIVTTAHPTLAAIHHDLHALALGPENVLFGWTGSGELMCVDPVSGGLLQNVEYDDASARMLDVS